MHLLRGVTFYAVYYICQVANSEVNSNAGAFAGGGCQTSPDCKAGTAAPLDAGQPPPLP